MKKAMVWFMALLFPVVFAACGGGGGGGGGSSNNNNNNTTTATALTVASKVSVVDAQLSGSVASGAAPLKIGWASIMRALSKAPATTSDFYTDKTQVWVNERSVETLDNVNNILCMVAQTKYDAMLNKGAYIALVDKNLCSSNKSDASTAGQASQNQSSSATMPDYMKFVVDSSRVDDNHDEIVKAWVHDKTGPNDQPALIFAHIVVSEGTSSTNPYGIFQLNFAGYPLDSNGALIGYPSTPVFKGILEAVREVSSDPTSTVVLKFAQKENYQDGYCGTTTHLQKITLDKGAGVGKVMDGRSSTGTVNSLSSDCTGTTMFGIAFNPTDFFRQDLITLGSPTYCLSRSAFSESAWSYGLYDSTTGARVNRNSGFPITYTSGGTTYQGWIGYWGLWINTLGVTIPDGATVNKVDYNNGSTTSAIYYVAQRGGKLKKHTKKSLTLNNIQGVPLNYWEQPISGGSGTQYQVVWDGSNFNKIAYMPQCNGNCFWTDIPSPYPTIDISHLQWSQLNFGFQTGGGQVMVTLGTCTYVPGTMSTPGYTDCSSYPPTNATPVIAYLEDIVYPDDSMVPTTLACFDNCPKATVTGINPNDPFVSNMMTGPSQTATSYNFTNGMLTDMTGTAEIWTSGTSTMNQWGIMSGPLFDSVYSTPSPTNPLDCDWDQTQICGWKAWGVLNEFYTWETGTNSWNQFIGLRSTPTSTFLQFDPPLQIQYVGLGVSPSGAYYGTLGTTYMLDYSGFGQLNGIPGKCVNIDTGADADCSQSATSQSIRWVPQFTIPSATTGGLTTVIATNPADNSSATYYVKPLQVEQRMAADTPSNCSTLSSTDFSVYTLPILSSLWSDPVAANGAEPAVTNAPAVIGGVVQ